MELHMFWKKSLSGENDIQKDKNICVLFERISFELNVSGFKFQLSPCESQFIQQPVVFIKHGLLVSFALGLLSLHLQVEFLILLQKMV